MPKIFSKIKNRGNGTKYRVFLEVDNNIYGNINEIIVESIKYDPATLIEQGQWFYVDSFSKKDYSTGICSEMFNPIDYPTMTREEYDSIDYIFLVEHDCIFFQRLSKTKLIRKKGILRIGNNFEYYDDYATIPIKDSPDAIYDRNTDTLYFREISHISGIFIGIGELYREATDSEVESFLTQDFINLGEDFNAGKVKTPNRKRIALAMETFSKLNKKEKKKIYSYIAEYCPNIKMDEKSFRVNSDEDLKFLLYGLEERFYTTRVGNEKRIANSVIKL